MMKPCFLEVVMSKIIQGSSINVYLPGVGLGLILAHVQDFTCTLLLRYYLGT